MSDDPARNKSRGYAGLVLLPWLFGLLAYWIIVVVDPYHLRRDGPVFQLADHRYPEDEWTRLLNVITRQPHNVVLLGGSTIMAMNPPLLRKAFPGALNPVNLSYLAPRPLDMPFLYPKIARIPELKRLVLIMDFTLLQSDFHPSPTGEFLKGLASTNWSHGGDFALSTALASLHAMASGTYDLPGWAALTLPSYMVGGEPLTQSADAMHKISDSLLRHSGDVFASSALSCSRIPFLDGILAPFLREMASRHVAVDLVFPAVPYGLYYDWIDNRPPVSQGTLLPGPVFDQFMVYEKCVVATRDKVGADDIRVLALDSTDQISGDLRRYLDTLHLIDATAYQLEAQMIANGDGQITSGNFDQHEAELRAKVTRWAASQTDAH